jgi:c-di-GMP phosphodiesterase
MSRTTLSTALLGYAPVIDDQKIIAGFRLQAIASAGRDAPELGRMYSELLPHLKPESPGILLACGGDQFPETIDQVEPDPRLWVELNATEVATEMGEALLARLAGKGFCVVMRGAPIKPLPPTLADAVKMSLVGNEASVDTDQANQAGASRRLVPYSQGGVTRIDQMERSFARGAVACVGWPWDDALERKSAGKAAPELSTISEMMTAINRGAEPPELETIIKKDPSMAYRMLRYINSPGFGLPTQVDSFGHAIMLLGTNKLKRWLGLLLVNSNKDPNMRAIASASFRRAMLLEQLVALPKGDPMRDEIFMIGVFSLLDKLFQTPFEQLFENLPVPESVYSTLVEKVGPHKPYLDVVEAIERGPMPVLDDKMDRALIAIEHCSAAVINTITLPELSGPN